MSRGFIDGCEQERLHLSGAIQPFGVLLKVDRAGYITHASANVHEVIGLGADEAIGTHVDSLNLPHGTPVQRTDRRARRQAVTHRGITLSVLAIVASDGGMLLEMIPQAARSAPAHAGSVVRKAHPPSSEADIRTHHQRLVDEIAKRTGYARTMYYQFHDDGHGEVIAEARNGTAFGSYQGLHFPASDIPKIARALYLQNPWRIIPDATADPVALLTRSTDPVDLTRSDLRSVSEVHRAYLANMGVGSALSFPVAAADTLTALISCHHAGPRHPDIGVLDDIAALVDAHALAVSSLRAGQRMRLIDGMARRFRDIETLIATTEGIEDVWPVLGPRLMAEFGADGAVVCVGDTIYPVGQCLDDDTLGRVEQVSFDRGAVVWKSDSLIRDVEDLMLTPVAGAAGLVIETSARQRVRLWVSRAEHIDEVTWGGNPDKPLESDSVDKPISPRRSFEAWVERRIGYCRPWTTETELLLRHLRVALRPLAQKACR